MTVTRPSDNQGGDRVRLDGAKRQRLPREERMRGCKEVEVRHADQFFDPFEEAVPVAVELRRNAESLIDGFLVLPAISR